MVRIKTVDLIGAQLDWAVAKADGIADEDIFWRKGGGFWAYGHNYGYSPSTDWAKGGPIIERERMMVSPALEEGYWYAKRFQTVGYGKSPLVAAMRAFAASKLGNEVEVPEVVNV